MTEISGDGVSGRFDDLLAGRALVFPPPDRVFTAVTAADVRPVLAEVERATAGGAWAFGFVGYEAAAGLDAGLAVVADGAGTPLARFAVTAAPRLEPLIDSPSGERGYWCSGWRLDRSVADYRRAVTTALAEIAAGNIYQANITVRAGATVRGELAELYADVVHAQHAAYNACLDFGDVAVLSASPELFFEWAPPRLRCVPMKGTAPRGATPAQDHDLGAALSASSKDIAENVMIVDLVRNDVGRIARTGTVHVPRLCRREAYPSVWQLVSDVEATLVDGVGLSDIFTALFPSGSVTGAPKAEAMRVIRDLEAGPRGPYCGAVGWVAPPTEPVRARFNVAIRTIAVDRTDGRAVYGTGGGITAASDPDGEYRELRLKTAVLAVTEPDPGDELELIETLAYQPGTGLRNADRHLARMAASARYFGWVFDEPAVRAAAQRAVAGHRSARVRLGLRAGGDIAVDVAPLPAPPSGPVRIAVDTEPVPADLLWLRHKTNRRATYDAARARHPGADDVVLINEHDEITETSIANIAVCVGGTWLTPPVDAGCLPGVGRAVALAEGRVAAAPITVAALRGAEEIALISSLRGWRPARLI